MWTYICFCITIIQISRSDIDKDHYDYLKKSLNVECGRSSSSHKTSRIINGFPSKQNYPWMAEVVIFVAHNPQFKPKKKFSFGLPCGGVVITDRVVLTAGHCVCIGILHPREEKTLNLLETCVHDRKRIDGSSEEYNHNQKDINEIHINVGQTNTISTLQWVANQPQFDPNLQAFLYKYDRPESYDDMLHTFSPNGDIAVVVKQGGPPFPISSGTRSVVPICLPSPDTFHVKDGFKVKVAGRGLRYQAPILDDVTGNMHPSSCQTNEGTTTSNEHLRKRNFLPCKKPQTQIPTEENVLKDIEYCSNFLNEQNVNSFSVQDDFELGPNGWKFKGNNARYCEFYYRKAKLAWVKDRVAKKAISSKILMDEFDKEVKRFQIKVQNDDGSLGTPIETCYNVNALGQYGICQIDNDNNNFGFQWGFCSRSCRKQNARVLGYLESNEPYEEAEFEYFDNAPPYTLFAKEMQSRERSQEMQSIFKCIKSIIPRASTHIFSRYFQGNIEELKVEYELKDESLDELEMYNIKDASGHVVPYAGDSGSPFWITDASDRAVLIALVSSKVGPKYESKTVFNENREMKCGNKATKINEDVLLWIKRKAGIPVRRGTKRAFEDNPQPSTSKETE